MQDNYFVPSFGNRPRNLVGRDNCLREFENALKSNPGSRERSLLVLGQRGFGKTVLLLEMADMAAKQGFIVASPTITSSEMNERILEKLYYSGEKAIVKDKKRITGASVSVLGFGAGLQFQGDDSKHLSFAFRLTEFCREATKSGLGVLILIDEVQANSEELKQLIIAYQEIVGESGNIALVMAGLPGAISATLNDHVLTFLNRSKKMELDPLDIKDIQSYYIDAFRTANVNITGELCWKAAKFTEGSPYLMQLVGHNIIMYADNEGKLLNEDFDFALSEAKKDYINDIGKTVLNSLSDKDIVFLKAMSEDEGVSSISDIIDRMGVSNAYAQLYKKRLIDAGVIEQPKRGYVEFSIAHLRDYLVEI